MAEEKIIVINVVTNTDDLKKLEPALKKVENQAKQTGKSTKDSFRGSQAAADRLGGGLSGIAEQFVMVGKAAKKGGLAMKSALLSTGVGAIIVALGVIVDNWEYD